MNILRIIIGFIFLSITTSASAQKVERIVSLTPSLTKNIYFLEAQDKLVGCTNYCLEGVADNKEIVASAVKVNLEKVISLKPDLILASNLTEPETLDMLRKFDIRVEVFPKVESFDAICDQFLKMGKLIGHESKATEIISESKLKVDELSKQLTLSEKNNIFFQIGADPIFTVLPNTFMNDFITLIGGRNVAENQTKGTITRESVVAHNPDYIFVVTMGIMGKQEKENWLGFPDLSASKGENVFVVDADKACTPTPITFVETLDTIVSLIKNGK